MPKRFFRKLASLEIEEQILNLGSIVAFIGVFLPWAGGEWLGGETVTHAGFGFYTGYIGIAVLGIHAYILLLTLIPLSGGFSPVRKENRDRFRFFAALQAVVLTLAALTVIANTTLEFARMEIRFGIYVSLIGSLVASLYAFLRYQDQKRTEVQELFHYAKEQNLSRAVSQPNAMTPPQAEPEQHKTYSSPLQR